MRERDALTNADGRDAQITGRQATPHSETQLAARDLATLARRVAHPLSAAVVVAALGVTTAFVVLALRGHFQGSANRTPVGLVTPVPAPTTAAPSSGPTPTALASGPQQISGAVATDVVIGLSSDNADSVTIPAGTPVQAQVTAANGQLMVTDLIAGQRPRPGKGEDKQAVSGSSATTTTITVATAAGTLSLTVAQDAAVNGTADNPLALEISSQLP